MSQFSLPSYETLIQTETFLLKKFIKLENYFDNISDQFRDLEGVFTQVFSKPENSRLKAVKQGGSWGLLAGILLCNPLLGTVLGALTGFTSYNNQASQSPKNKKYRSKKTRPLFIRVMDAIVLQAALIPEEKIQPSVEPRENRSPGKSERQLNQTENKEPPKKTAEKEKIKKQRK